MTVTDVQGPAPAAGPFRRLRARTDGRDLWRDGALLGFAGLAVVAFAYFLFIGRHNWFFFDEWDFLASRTAGSLNDLLTPHTDEHWSTVPILVYRLNYTLFGLRSYLPYEALSVALHIAIAALLRTVMRRAGVHPWWATAVAGSFLFFGVGAYNIIWAFQINFDFAVAFGLVQLLLADHDGPFDRRDALGLLAGLLALMSSAPAVVMVVAVGIATLVRRGWRMAAAHAVPLGVIYVAWRAHYSHTQKLLFSVAGVRHFIGDGVRTTVEAMTGSTVAALLVGAVFVAGCALVVRRDGWDATARARLAAPFGLLCGVPVFFVVTSLGRSLTFFAGGPTAPRYLYIALALALPAFAVACDALTRRTLFTLPIALLLVVGLPHNLHEARNFAELEMKLSGVTRQELTSLPNDPLARQVRPGLRPDPTGAPQITMSWLLAAKDSGRLPDPWRPNDNVAATNHMRLALDETNQRVPDYGCARLRFYTFVQLRKGDHFGINGGVVYVSEVAPGAKADPLLFGATFLNPSPSYTITATTGPLDLRISKAPGYVNRPSLCLRTMPRSP